MKRNSFFSEDVSEARNGTGIDAGDDELRAMNALEAGIRKGVPASHFKDTLGNPLSPRQRRWLFERLERADTWLKLRLFHYTGMATGDVSWMDRGFEALCETMLADAASDLGISADARIAMHRHDVLLPLRVNWAGGWSDVAPYCIERGGTVLNAAILLNGAFPVRVSLTRLEQRQIVLESTDMGVRQAFDSLAALQCADDSSDPLALHKAVLMASGVVPMHGGEMEDLLTRLGGGFILRTEVTGVPNGSGLGTSCILSAACIKALYGFLGLDFSEEDVCGRVMTAEQLTSTGGGWEDQIGALWPGVKYLSSAPGMRQRVSIQTLMLSEDTMSELRRRYVLIYTGQRRQTKRILRDIMGDYLGNETEVVQALAEIQRVAASMRAELEHGHVDEFARLMSYHWGLSKQMDSGSSNARIERIFEAADGLLDGRMCVGSGGGGFLQVMLKSDATREQLAGLLHEAFRDEGVAVWDCEIV